MGCLENIRTRLFSSAKIFHFVGEFLKMYKYFARTSFAYTEINNKYNVQKYKNI